MGNETSGLKEEDSGDQHFNSSNHGAAYQSQHQHHDGSNEDHQSTNNNGNSNTSTTTNTNNNSSKLSRGSKLTALLRGQSRSNKSINRSSSSITTGADSPLLSDNTNVNTNSNSNSSSNTGSLNMSLKLSPHELQQQQLNQQNQQNQHYAQNDNNDRKKKLQLRHQLTQQRIKQNHQQQHQQQHPQVDVMYASTMETIAKEMGELQLQNNNNNNNNNNIHSRQHYKSSPTSNTNNDEDQWRRQWDEDSDSDDEDDDERQQQQQQQQQQLKPAAATMASPKSPQRIPSAAATATNTDTSHFRPMMDGSHSSSLPGHYTQQQQYTLPRRGDDDDDDVGVGVGVDMSRSMGSVQTVNGTMYESSLPPPPARQQQQLQQQQQQQQHHRTNSERVVLQRVDQVMGEGANGVEWDTESDTGSSVTEYERPNPTMFSPLRVLGKGSFGTVFLVQKQRGQEGGGLFAMKRLHKTHLLQKGQIERTKTERKVLSLVDHPFIMKLHFAFQTDDKLFLVLDYCAGGELFFHLSRHRKFPESFTRFYAAELLLALGHCHSKGIIYRDLKPENVLLDAEGHVKLGDFGLAKDNVRHPYQGANSMCGTPEYMAPEILDSQGHGFCVDYWGVGMLVYEMLTGLPPWYTTDRRMLYRRLRSAPLNIPRDFSSRASSFVYALLQRDPRRRLGVRGARAVMSHEFFREINFRQIMNREIQAPIRPCEEWRQQTSSNMAASAAAAVRSTTAAPANPTTTTTTHSPARGRSECPQRNNRQSDGNNNSPQRHHKHHQSAPPEMSASDLDLATQCFDRQFTKLPVNSVDHDQNGGEGGESSSYVDPEDCVDSDEFVGFTFDENTDF